MECLRAWCFTVSRETVKDALSTLTVLWRYPVQQEERTPPTIKWGGPDGERTTWHSPRLQAISGPLHCGHVCQDGLSLLRAKQ